MKLAELRAEATYRTHDIQFFENLRKNGNSKAVFNCLSFDYNDKCYSLTADSIFKAVSLHDKTFAAEVAANGRKATYPLSDKQLWCVAFAFIKIQNELTEEIF